MIDLELRAEFYNSAVSFLSGEADAAEIAEFYDQRSSRDPGAKGVLEWLYELSQREPRDRAEWLVNDYAQDAVFRRLLFLASEGEYRWTGDQAAGCGLFLAMVFGIAVLTALLGLFAVTLGLLGVVIGIVLGGPMLILLIWKHHHRPRGDLDVWPFFTAEEYEQTRAARGEQVRRDVDKIAAFAWQTLTTGSGETDPQGRQPR